MDTEVCNRCGGYGEASHVTGQAGDTVETLLCPRCIGRGYVSNYLSSITPPSDAKKKAALNSAWKAMKNFLKKQKK